MIKVLEKFDLDHENPMDKSLKNRASVVGTPYYLAPEILLGVGHGIEVDFFALGVVLFEFLNGYPPFLGETPEEIFYSIQTNEISWPAQESDDMSPTVKDLIKKLLHPNPKERLGAKGIEELKSHPWFKGIDFSNILFTDPPFVPKVEEEEDLTFFEVRNENWPMDDDIKFQEDGEDEDNEDGEFEDNWWYINLENLANMNSKIAKSKKSDSNMRKSNNLFDK